MEILTYAFAAAVIVALLAVIGLGVALIWQAMVLLSIAESLHGVRGLSDRDSKWRKQ